MLYANLVGGRTIMASDLMQVTRSNKYSCIHCAQDVSFIRGNDDRCAHFRHITSETCIDRNSKNQIILNNEQAEFNISNGKSVFHTQWQADFPLTAKEVRIERDENTHIADIFVKNVDAFRLGKENFVGGKGKDLVIEVQHSPISLKDAMAREEFYRTNECELLWVFDISPMPHEVERIMTITKDQSRILFFGPQHAGVPNVVKAWELLGKKPNMILDDGSPTLFFVSEMPKLDEECMSVVCIDRADFMSYIGTYVEIEDGWKRNMKNTVAIKMMDYSKLIPTHLADSLFNCFVFTPLDMRSSSVVSTTTKSSHSSTESPTG